MEGTHDIPYKNSYFFVTNVLMNQIGWGFGKMQVISYTCSFIILKHIQIDSQFWILLMLKLWLNFFLDNRYSPQPEYGTSLEQD